MTRAVFGVLACCALAAALRLPAAAFAYCPVSVEAIQGLQYGATDAYHKAVDRRFGVELRSEQPRTAEVELSIAASGEIYRTKFNDLIFKGGDDAIAFFSFDRPKTVDYVWVSRVTQAQDDIKCPLDPFHASHEYFNDRHLTRADLAARQAANERVLLASKEARMSDPQVVARIRRDCAEPDQTPTLNHEVTPNGGDLRSLKGPTPVVAVVNVSPSGEPLNVELLESSPFPRLNGAVLESARTSTYNPATIDCMPSTGTYLFKALFGT
ncbi:MAG: energy transducer TonB [Candidatus Eremiobacteraeota bacterium]|nr:energy transducer TonB [Candidatus Eremiobacteraeota bacterium]